MLKCICCNKIIEPLLHKGEVFNIDNHPERGMYMDAAVDVIAANYGSIYDGNVYLIALCDDCIKKKKPILLRNYMDDEFR